MVKFADLPKLHDECEVSPIQVTGKEEVVYQSARIIKDNLTGEIRLLSTIRVKSDVCEHGFWEHTAHIPATLLAIHRVPERPADHWISDNLPYKRDSSHWFNVTESELGYCTE
jgi:hypothetical protein